MHGGTRNGKRERKRHIDKATLEAIPKEELVILPR